MASKFQTKVCPRCNKEHNKAGTFCSRTCANARTHSAETKKKQSEANKKYWETLSESHKVAKMKILQQHSTGKTRRCMVNLLRDDWDNLGYQVKRLKVILEQDGKCNHCGISEWRGKTITLEFEHKDGNNGNNARDNVEALCPNCHSQTDTWRGRQNGITQSKVEKYLNLKKEIGASGEIRTLNMRESTA